MTIYQVFVRNHTLEGTFFSLEKDLDRIKSLGVDVLYLLPIHEIGLKDRKGRYGSPYSIKDYRSISEDLGTLDDFKHLLVAAHDIGLKVMMDIVFHHTSRDAIYIEQHPEWYVYKGGKLANKVGDWSDICDFNFHHESLENYLIDTLLYWTKLGVDGFRFDVASMLPIRFLKKARKAVENVNPNTLWLGESIELDFLEYLRSKGEVGEDDATLYQAFDILYDYDIFKEFKLAIKDNDKIPLYIEALNQQRKRHGHHLKLHFLENHDQVRIASLLDTKSQVNWIKFMFMIRGVNFIYAGEEYGQQHQPHLFEKDPIDWSYQNQTIHQAYLTAIKTKKEMAAQGVEVCDIIAQPHGVVQLVFSQAFRGETSTFIDLSHPSFY